MNKRLANLMQSEIRNMSIECDRVGGINLSQGICDLPLTNELVEGAGQAILTGINQYTRYDGIEELRSAISRKAKAYNGIDADPAKNITVTAGATGALYCACFSLLMPEDEVLLFEPFYGYHEYTLLANDLVPVYVKLSPPGWTFNIGELEKKVTKKTKAIIVNTPANPCGKVFTREEIELLGEFCIAHDLFIFTDEIYEYIIYDGRKHISPGSINKIKDRVITISGYSKTFSITGWRIGYSIASERNARMIGMANDLIYVCAPAPLQFAVANAINRLDKSFYDDLRKRFIVKREIICSALQECGITPYVPQGAYYVLADIGRAKGATSKEKCMWLLENAGVACVPGESFYNKTGGEAMARFCFAKDDRVLHDAAARMKKLFKNL